MDFIQKAKDKKLNPEISLKQMNEIRLRNWNEALNNNIARIVQANRDMIIEDEA